MIVSLIVAMDRLHGIGLKSGLPWHLSSDLKRFKALTMGHYLIMGRKTYESIGKPLPGRKMIVITRNPSFAAEGCLVVHSMDDALEVTRRNGEDEVFVIGGGEIFQQALPLAERIYLTCVHATTEADVFFPLFDPDEWQEQETSYVPAGPGNEFDHTFKLLVRVGKIDQPR